MLAALSAALAAMLGIPLWSASATGAGSLAVTGYVEQGSAAAVIDRSAPALSTVGVDGVNLDRTGGAVTAVDGSARSLLQRAHTDGLRGELLFGNYDNAIGDFSPRIAADLLHSARNIRVVAAQLTTITTSQGWNGVTVDLESLDGTDRAGLVHFVTALRADLPVGRSLSIDVGAATSLSDYAASGFDLTRLGHVVDRVVLMAYDQHGPWSQPGPIGAIDWQRQSLAVLLTRVSAAKVDLGVAGYGYTWPKGSALHHGTSLSDAQARQLTGRAVARTRWVKASGEWTATLNNGTILWWSDARSYRLRLALARRFSLHGVAVWQLASSDPLVQ